MSFVDLRVSLLQPHQSLDLRTPFPMCLDSSSGDTYPPRTGRPRPRRPRQALTPVLRPLTSVDDIDPTSGIFSLLSLFFVLSLLVQESGRGG